METSVKKDIIITDEVIQHYLNPNETVVGMGLGGSESLTLFIKSPESHETIVRKILSEKLITAKWDRNGTDVMLAPYKKALQQAYFLKDLPEKVKHFFPRVDHIIERSVPADDDSSNEYKELIYDMSFIEGIEVSEFIRKHNPSSAVVAQLYLQIFRVLNEIVHSQRIRKPSEPTLEASYFRKIEERLELSRKTSPKVFSDALLKSKYIYIDGIKHLNVKPLLEKFRASKKYRDILEPQHHSLVMGDTNTENIKITKPYTLLNFIARGSLDFTYEDIGLKFLDPRAIGFHENGVDTGADDPMYDNKPWHNSLGQYDVIHSEYFDLVVNKNYDGMSIEVIPFENHPYTNSYDDIEIYFKDVMNKAWELDQQHSQKSQNDPHWLVRFAFVMGTHFTAMPPFHFHKNDDGSFTDDYANQRRPVAIYAEGIKWLNLALNMLEGRVAQFYGIPVNNFKREAA